MSNKAQQSQHDGKVDTEDTPSVLDGSENKMLMCLDSPPNGDEWSQCDNKREHLARWQSSNIVVWPWLNGEQRQCKCGRSQEVSRRSASRPQVAQRVSVASTAAANLASTTTAPTLNYCTSLAHICSYYGAGVVDSGISRIPSTTTIPQQISCTQDSTIHFTHLAT